MRFFFIFPLIFLRCRRTIKARIKRGDTMKKLALLLGVLLFLSGCGKTPAPNTAYRAVTGIDIVTNQDGQILRRHYTAPEKMQYVLTFLRLLTPVGKPDTDPEQLTENMFLIALTRSDGSRVYYRQTAHRYVCKNDQDWFSIDPAQAAKLYQLMAHIPGDPPRKNSK